MPPFFSVVMPVLDGGEVFECCLAALLASDFDSYEVIVVDDGSADGSGDRARALGARVIETGGRAGPAAARNLGAAAAGGSYLLFVDADCEVAHDTLSAMAAVVDRDPGLAAAFGSYDDSPAAGSLVSQYKNLQHHWVHQAGSEEATTFWAGCGAVRRSVFAEVGGFDAERFARPSIEDIELGGRLRAAGHRIRLAKNVQVKHHKRWRLGGLVRTDVLDRGIPWARLMLSNRSLSSDLNLSLTGRASGIVSWLLLLSLLAAGAISWNLLWPAGLLAIVLLVLNRDFYAFLLRRRGPGFVLGAVPLHWLYYLYSVVAFGLALIGHLLSGGTASRG